MSLQWSSFDRANPNDIDDLLRQIAIGSLLQGQVPQAYRKANLSVADPNNLATLGVLKLPDNGKASLIHRAYARAGGVTLGELAVQSFGTTPTTGQIAVTPTGDIACLLSDAFTSVDIIFTPERGDGNAVDKNGDPKLNSDGVTPANGNYYPVASNVLTFPASVTAQGIILVTEAEAVTATSTGKKIVLVPGSGAPSAGQCRLNLAKTTLTFATADAVTRARVKLLLCASKDLATILNASATLI